MLCKLQVGTVLDRQSAKDAVNLGAKFILSPAMVKVSLKSCSIYLNQKQLLCELVVVKRNFSQVSFFEECRSSSYLPTCDGGREF